MAAAGPRRSNQKSRTRKDLLQAAARLIRAGRTPTLEEVAEEALVSRATAYRYFPGVEALLLESALDVAFPGADALFVDTDTADPVARLQRVDEVVAAMARENAPALRAMLVHSLQQKTDLPTRQNRRTPLIEAALAPARGDFPSRDYERLVRALALVVGTESMLVFKDVLRLDDAEADDVRRWMIAALTESAKAGRTAKRLS